MIIAGSLRRIEDVVGVESKRFLRPAATPEAIKAAEKKLGVPFPRALRELYEWHDGEVPTSSLFHDALQAEYADQWGAFSEQPFEISFMSLEEVVRAGATDLWVDGPHVAVRSEEEAGGADKAAAVPFLWIHAPGPASTEPRDVTDSDWLLAVDTLRGAVWLFEPGAQGLEDVVDESPSLREWLDLTATKMRKTRPAKVKAPPPKLDAPSVLCVRFLLDRKLIELAEGVAVADVANGIAPHLTLKPPKRAVRAVIDHLSDDAAIEEVFADDELLGRIIIEFVD